MLRARSRRKPVGVAIVEVLAVTGIMAGLQSGGNWRYAVSKANEVRGIQHLRQIHQLLLIQSITSTLPRAAFYPKGDPRKDPKSIIRLIPGAPPALFTSPFAPPALQAKVLTYAWNTAANGKRLDALPRGTWLLADLAAFIADPKIPRPKRYLILYSDGKAQAVTSLPPDIVRAVREARARSGTGTPKATPSRRRPTPRRSQRRKTKPSDLIRRIPRIPRIPMPPSVPGL